MTRAIPGTILALAIGLLVAGCGGSGTPHPTHAALFQGFGDTVGAKLAKGGASTASDVVSQMGNSWLP